ncbi:MAG: branched-chain amino acid ABC transporter permease [Actinobacteria bacterium]|nr:branched-chain amino acid ABC transporter permease [Actinomycetota bacterium]
MGFVAIGAAVSAKCMSAWQTDMTLSILVAAFAGGLAAFLVGIPALRLRGLYLAVVTLIFAVSVTEWLLNDRFFDWIPDSRVKRLPLFGRLDIDTPTRFYAYTLIVLIISFLAVRGIRRSRTGRAILALRDNERGAQAFAVPTLKVKLTAFTISGSIAGVAGALYAQLNYSFDISSFQVGRSVEVFTASIVGGLGSLFGAVLGAVYLRGVEWFVTADEWRFLSTAAGVLFVLLVLPGGLGALVIRIRDELARRIAARSGGAE